MNIHEYQAKNILKKYDVPVPPSEVAFSAEEAYSIAKNLPFPNIVVKAQVHTGGRGKAGGIKFAKSPDDVLHFSEELIGHKLVTHQTGPQGERIEAVLLEAPSEIEHEYYLSFVLDRSVNKIVLMASTEGGMDIEEVAEKTPEKILRETIDPLVGLAPFQTTKLAFGLNIPAELRREFSSIITKLYQIYIDLDCSILEINPFVLTKKNELYILDAKFNFDENALYRHPEVQALESDEDKNSVENQAAEYGLSYISLDGNIGCLVNGAGLAMATMDIINYYGASPANFLDVGGGATEETVQKGFEFILQDEKVDGILVNIFGGIMRCDIIARGIIAAVENIGLDVPLVVRLDGTKSKEGKEILDQSELNITAAVSLAEGAQKIIELTK